MNPRRDACLMVAAALVGIAFIAAVYLPDVGRGFVKDDFRWIGDAQTLLADPARPLSLHGPDFFRPMVTASFAMDYAWHGLNARAYGFTNLALYLVCIGAVWRLLRDCGIGAAAASVGAFAWAVNPHGLNMAIVWISGRTSLLLTLWATLAAIAFLRRARQAGAVLLFAALLSKEEATLLPLILFGWICILREGDWRSRLADAAALTAPAALYFAFRARTPALTFATAPEHYAPTADATLLVLNALEYLDRGLTIFVIVVGAAALVYGWQGLGAVRRRTIAAGAVWFAGGFALTIWIPVRSSLYAVFPSVGAALICAEAVTALRTHTSRLARGDIALTAMIASILAFVPIYQDRNDRWVEPARLSARTLRAMAANAPAVDGLVLLEDEPGRYTTFADAFGPFATEAARLATGRPVVARIVMGATPDLHGVAAHYILTGGRIDRVE